MSGYNVHQGYEVSHFCESFLKKEFKNQFDSQYFESQFEIFEIYVKNILLW